MCCLILPGDSFRFSLKLVDLTLRRMMRVVRRLFLTFPPAPKQTYRLGVEVSASQHPLSSGKKIAGLELGHVVGFCA